MFVPQTTLRCATSWVEGLHLDQDARARVRFLPADPEEGIVFVRADLPGAPEVRCVPENLQSMPRWTALESGGSWVHHTEHVLAALAFCSVDNVRVEMDADRLPMMPGGTCLPFVEAIRTAGLRAMNLARSVYRLRGSVVHLDVQSTIGEPLASPSIRNGRYIVAQPSDQLRVTSVFHWPHVEHLPLGVAECEMSEKGVDPSVLQSRSYLVDCEKEEVRGLLGPVQDQVMMLYPGCPPALGMEAARHKIVDFIGDMMILGRPIVGQFVIVRTGHRIHHDLVRALDREGLLERLEMPV